SVTGIRPRGGRSRTRISFFFFQAEDGIRDFHVTGVQTCALPISALAQRQPAPPQEDEIAVADALEQLPEDSDEKSGLVRTQLALMLRLLPRLRAVAAEAITPVNSAPRPSPAPA